MFHLFSWALVIHIMCPGLLSLLCFMWSKCSWSALVNFYYWIYVDMTLKVSFCGKWSCCSVSAHLWCTFFPSSLFCAYSPFLLRLPSICLCRGVKPGAGPPSVGGWGSQHIDDAAGFPSGRQSEWGASRYPVQHGGTRAQTGNDLTHLPHPVLL